MTHDEPTHGDRAQRPRSTAPADYAERNRRSWNHATRAHNSHKRDQAGFFKGGGDTLFSDELDLLGPVQGVRIAHLQCNSGQDTLSLARRGAKVVGVDISDEAIAFARSLATECRIEGTFEQAEILTWMRAAADAGERFDVAFASYGAIGWIDDLGAWMRGAAGILRPGGRLVLIEFHPIVWTIGGDGLTGDPYFIEEPLLEDGGVEDYVAKSGEGLSPMGFASGVESFENPEPCVCFQWTVAEILQSAIDAGLVIRTVREYPYANGCRFHADARAMDDRRYLTPAGVPSLPLMLGLVAERPA